MLAFVFFALLSLPSTCFAGHQVNSVTFVNQCHRAVYIKEWNDQRVGPGESWTVDRPSTVPDNRLQWRLDGYTWYDFLELNGRWPGPSGNLWGTPTYSTYQGWTTSSRFDILQNGQVACDTCSCIFDVSDTTCPGRTGGYMGQRCDGNGGSDTWPPTSPAGKYIYDQNHFANGQRKVRGVYCNYWADSAHMPCQNCEGMMVGFSGSVDFRISICINGGLYENATTQNATILV